MFALLAGPGAAAGEALGRMAASLRGGPGVPRLWRDPERAAGAASLAPDFVPEDRFDAQPIVREDRVFVCQARIDNRDELLETLGIAAEAPVADSALLAAAYDRWAEACLHRVVGDFAFAVRHRDGRIVAAVDPLGARRILWARIGSGIALSAQLPALLAHPGVSREPDFEALAGLLDIGVDRTSTPYTGIRALPGGHLLVWRGGEPRVERWWNPGHEPTIWHSDPRDYVEEARELFTRALTAQLRSSSPISSTLSGGLDSGCVTATAARLLAPRGERLTAYTSVPEDGLATSKRPNWEPDDRFYAAEVAAACNVDHKLVAPAGRSTLDVSRLVYERSRTPVKSATNLLWLDGIAAAASASGSRVLLVGQQGNAGFSWRGEDTIWELAMLRGLRPALAQARLEAHGGQASLARVLGGVARGRLRAWSGRSYGQGLRSPGLRFVNSRYRPSPQARGNEYAQPAGSRAFWAAFMTTPRNIYWAEPVLQWGIEWRDPMADRRLLERLLQFPQAAFRIGGRHRGLTREIAAGLLPDRVRLRRTQGAQVPEAPSLIAAHALHYKAALDAMRGSDCCRELLDLEALDRAVDGFVAGARDYHLALTVDRGFNTGLFLAELERES
jgi:asparagine synthase (glutamine-hydrolysing)